MQNKDLSLSTKAIVRQMLGRAAQIPVLRPALIAYYENKTSTNNWDKQHPCDRAHGVRTSGMLPGFLLRPGEPMDVPTTIYSAAQPSIIRQALATIPDPQHCHFLDLGCGKGRPLLVATEFHFAAIIGVELSPTLSRIARRNADVFSRVHPDRGPIVVVVGDALVHELPAEKLVIFLYNPFHRPLIAQLLRRLESSLETISRELYIVYYNPSGPTCSTRQPLLNAASLPSFLTIKAKSATARTSQMSSWCGKIAATPTRAHRAHARLRSPSSLPAGELRWPGISASQPNPVS
jgi:SAM-dependent methyltransferase